MNKLKIPYPIIVEGKYDKIKLSSIVKAVIIPTHGFRIFKDEEMLALIRHYAETVGIIILTDADAAGFQIRNYLKGAVTKGKMYHVYIPGIHGKEKRKTAPSAEGTLGVEGMDTQTLLMALERAGVFQESSDNISVRKPITPAMLYEHGLMGTCDCTTRRRKLLCTLQLPPRLSVSGLCEVLNTMTDADGLAAFLDNALSISEESI